mmetsp:Transcript_9518/g.11042  ORF Transcript_9518/g.11042 Transcript_9518/m.11042 type:complete len:318 (+) Transcript_9518:258-1211(+)|eukprot:CAMPEP_0197853074 /NCGR_PEP_ID=MMETSP1438-20131217/22016_1 /TAXON_ID=1461541 /ORGANISM="Pterosperma sp., Strain CCMP1384" /LENGTH=317 /DNA_ID=CAMNT_0043467351 /DNA_START=249 /DNA_END=1202 /DNA_ORIENTATION=-
MVTVFTQSAGSAYGLARCSHRVQNSPDLRAFASWPVSFENTSTSTTGPGSGYFSKKCKQVPVSVKLFASRTSPFFNRSALYTSHNARPVKVNAGKTVSQAAEDLYEILGVSSAANKKELKSAYRKLALKYHPDVNKQPDAEAKFQRIKSAYNILADSEERAAYDRRRRTGGRDPFSDFDFGSGPSYRNTSGYRPKQSEEEFYGFSEFFKDLDEEIASFSEKVNKKGKKAADSKPKSLWEELADVGAAVGEEFLEFLEENMEQEKKEQQASSRSTRNSNDANRSSNSRDNKSTRSQSGSRKGESVDDMLEKLKRDMGL